MCHQWLFLSIVCHGLILDGKTCLMTITIMHIIVHCRNIMSRAVEETKNVKRRVIYLQSDFSSSL